MKLWKIVPLEEMVKYRVGDRVYSPHFGEGIITDIDEKASPTYPIVVEWTKELQPYHSHRDVYTIEGLYAVSPLRDPEYDIVSMEDAIFKNNISQNEGEKMHADDENFHVGDKVVSSEFGIGIVESITSDAGSIYPVTVRWTDGSKFPNTFEYFTENGVHDIQDEDPELDIYLLKGIDPSKNKEAKDDEEDE